MIMIAENWIRKVNIFLVGFYFCFFPMSDSIGTGAVGVGTYYVVASSPPTQQHINKQ
jgi:hypothetical protein